MQRILNLAGEVINALEICDEDVIQDIYLWVIQNQSSLIIYSDEYIKNKIRVYIDDNYSNTEENKFEEFQDIYPSYESVDELDKYFTSECIRDACNKLSVNKRFVIYHSFGFGNCEPLTPYEMSIKFKIPMTVTLDIKREALNDLRKVLSRSLF